MITESIAERVLCAIEKRLRSIRTDDGYETDAGLHVFRARRSLSIEQLPAVIIWDAGETPSEDLPSAECDQQLAINIEAHTEVNQDDTGEVLEQIKADVKHALFGDNPHGALLELKSSIAAFGYKGCVAFPREDGAASESITMHFIARYKENLAL